MIFMYYPSYIGLIYSKLPYIFCFVNKFLIFYGIVFIYFPVTS
ncbi:hypothetical protein CLOSTASPAR_00835 [[Clostridium] asparagiforme DSM 15981]|uniref:Uncharacterized protein n=1 Tax=[Clostridium] asparagiforme DSM 15981 TaxID=518636 RepID=C0CV34_9FIRM|nr:hypothetical protein CLOSTASPAR_00835 [[Clostridium] asparagiforme DSM 15981]